jgi:hypothetical protein
MAAYLSMELDPSATIVAGEMAGEFYRNRLALGHSKRASRPSLPAVVTFDF